MVKIYALLVCKILAQKSGHVNFFDKSQVWSVKQSADKMRRQNSSIEFLEVLIVRIFDIHKLILARVIFFVNVSIRTKPFSEELHPILRLVSDVIRIEDR